MSIRSKAKFLLGDDWIQRQQKIVQQHTNIHQHVAWEKVRLASQVFISILLSNIPIYFKGISIFYSFHSSLLLHYFVHHELTHVIGAFKNSLQIF